MKIRLVLEIGNVIGFIKTRFLKKRDSIKMCKHTEPFPKGNKLVTAVFMETLEICSTLFKRYLHENEALAQPYFLYENESL